jgi:hypothetical protein
MVVVCLIGVCVCVCVCVRARALTVLCCLIRGSSGCVIFFLVLCHYCLENWVIRNGVLVTYNFFCSRSPGNVLFFYGDRVFPFVSDMRHVRSVSCCVMCSVLMGVRISIFFLVDLHLLCWKECTRSLKRSMPILCLLIILCTILSIIHNNFIQSVLIRFSITL